jgi:hypothetical protein
MPFSKHRRKPGGKSVRHAGRGEPAATSEPRRHITEHEDERMWEVIVNSGRKIGRAEALRRYMAGWNDLPSREIEDAQAALSFLKLLGGGGHGRSGRRRNQDPRALLDRRAISFSSSRAIRKSRRAPNEGYSARGLARSAAALSLQCSSSVKMAGNLPGSRAGCRHGRVWRRVDRFASRAIRQPPPGGEASGARLLPCT